MNKPSGPRPSFAMHNRKTTRSAAITGAFHTAVKARKTGDAISLIEKGADVTRPDSDGWAPIRRAVETGDLALTKAILDTGRIDLHATDSNASQGWTLLHYAVRNGHVNIAAELLDRGADVNARTRELGWTPLHVSALHGRPEATRFLLSRKADIHASAPRRNGNTPLHNAAARGMCDDIRILLAHGADPKRKNDDGETPCDFAVMQNQLHGLAIMRAHIDSIENAQKLIRLKTARHGQARQPRNTALF